MKFVFSTFLTVIMLLGLFAVPSYGYQNSGSVRPNDGSFNRQFAHVRKTEDAGESDAIVRGDILSWDASVADGYTVTRVGANTAIGSNAMVCIALNPIATGDVRIHRCLVKGFVDEFLSWDATTAFLQFDRLCANASGQAVKCAACDTGTGANDCIHGNATENSGIISLRAEPGASGTNLKAHVNFR